MAIIAEQTVGSISYQLINDIYPTHSAITGTVVISNYGGIYTSVAPYDWCQNLKGNLVASMSSYDNAGATSFTVGSWTNLNALTWTAGSNIRGFTLSSSTMRINPDNIGLFLVTTSHTYEAGSARWASLEAAPAFTNFVPTRFNGGTHFGLAGSETSFLSARVGELDGRIGQYINVGNRQSAQQATQATSVRKHHAVNIIELDEPIKLIDKGSSLSFETNKWVTINDTTNKWVMGSATTFSGGGTSIYVSNDNGVTNAYTNTVAQVSHFYRDIDFPFNLDSDVFVSFNWKCSGETGLDYGRMYLIPTTITPVAGVELSDSYNVGATRYQGSGSYLNTHTSNWFSNVTRIPIARRENVRGVSGRLVFSWVNNASIGTNPPFVVDDFRFHYFAGRFVNPKTLFVSGFEGASISGDGWTVVQTGVNAWMNGTAEFKPSISGSTKAAYISNNGSTAAYTITVSTANHFYRDVTFPANKKTYLKFDWRCIGENAAGATQYDYGAVCIVDTSTTPVAGTEVITTQATAGGNGRIGATTNLGKFNTAYGGSAGLWNHEEIDLSLYAGQTKRLVITWKNDNVVGANPPMIIDNITMISEDI